jgi:RND family efflux transporter MFP subunit
MMRPRWFVMLGAATMLAAGCSQPPPPAEREVKPVRILEVSNSLIPMRELYGTAQASRTADLSYRFPGKLTSVQVSQGEQVITGQIIATLDQRELEARESQAASELESARAVLQQMQRGAREEDVQRLEAVVAARRAEADEARVQLERMTKLFEEQVISRAELDKATLASEVTASTLAAAELELTVAKSGARAEEIEAKQATIRGLEARLQDVRNNLQDTVLRAPFAGFVSRIHVNAFEDISAGQPIATLQDLSRIDIAVNVSEAQFGRNSATPLTEELRNRVVGMVEFPALEGRRYPIRVREFQTQADPQTQTFRVILQMEQAPPYPVKPGMNAIVRGERRAIAGEGDPFLVPLSAIRAGADGSKSVWVVDPTKSTVTARPVVTGEIIGGMVTITSGLNAGERITVTATNMLREGMKVEPMKDLGAL